MIVKTLIIFGIIIFIISLFVIAAWMIEEYPSVFAIIITFGFLLAISRIIAGMVWG